MKKSIGFCMLLLVLLSGMTAACSSEVVPVKTVVVEEYPMVTEAASASQPVGQLPLKPLSSKPESAEEGKLISVAGDYLFTEGPTVSSDGSVYFSDISAGKIYQWIPDGQVKVFAEGLSQPNGLALTSSGELIVCEGGKGRLISVNMRGQISPLVETYQQIRFNEPNDLWIDPQGGIYFTDPAYQSALVQDGEHVYYLPPNQTQAVRVIDDLVKSNGIVGSMDGNSLFVADHGAGVVYVYDITSDGMLSNKRLFAAVGADGIDLDTGGYLFLATTNKVQIFDAAGKHVRDIATPDNPTNIEFGGLDGATLFITARSEIYTLRMPSDVSLLEENASTAVSSDALGFTLSSPAVDSTGRLPEEFTCDGNSSTLPLEWSSAPEGTVSFALVMHHTAGPGDTHWYWVLYDIPANIAGLEKNTSGIGTLGTNSANNRAEYTPPCSKGPGDKEYVVTIYALSEQPQFSVPAGQVDRDQLLKAIQNITLASADIKVVYARK